VAGAEAYLHASFILIHLTVWPQYTNVSDREIDRQTDRTKRQKVNGLTA